MSAECFRWAKSKGDRFGFRRGESLRNDGRAEGLKLVFAAEGDVRGDEVELNRVERLPDTFEDLGGRAGDKEGELKSSSHCGGGPKVLVVRVPNVKHQRARAEVSRGKDELSERARAEVSRGKDELSERALRCMR